MELGPDDASALARATIGPRRFEVVSIGTGRGNRNWCVTDDEGSRFVLQIGPKSSAARWHSAAKGRSLAAALGLPCPREIHAVALTSAMVRVFEWIDGEPASSLATDPVAAARFGAELGDAVARLHSLDHHSFSSRLDDSAAGFTRWEDYVGHRLAQIRRRCEVVARPDARTVQLASAAIEDLAASVSDVARPTFCHRNLQADNLLVDPAGGLVAILDWDRAEIWDQPGDTHQLHSRLFPEVPGSADAFEASYGAAHPEQVRWEDRTRLVDLLESLDSVADAAQHAQPELAADAGRRLRSLLS